MADLEIVFASCILLGLLLLAGKTLRRQVKWLQKIFLPSSIAAGLIGLLLGPELWEPLTGRSGLWPEAVLSTWSALPSLLISVVFAGLFLGKKLPSLGSIWKKAGPMITHGQAIAWGQYVVGISVALLFLGPIWGLDPMSGALIEIGFEGGHGTAAGLAQSFRDLGFADGADLALGLATVGVVAGVVLGTVLINWALARGHLSRKELAGLDEPATIEELSDAENQSTEAAPEKRIADKAIEPLSIHIALIGLAILIGWLGLKGLQLLESWLLLPLGWPELMQHIPLFPLAMLGGVLLQVFGKNFSLIKSIDRSLITRISGTALDALIVAAMATLSLKAIGTHMAPFAILAFAGIAWNLFGFFVLAKWLFPKDWVQNGLANFGQGIGMTVIGLLLVRMSDPKNKSGAMEAFGYKQLLFEPIVGGGLFTAASLPLIYEFGAVPVLIGVSIVMAFWLFLGWWLFARKAPR